MEKQNSKVRLALPDGHLQVETRRLFKEAGLNLIGYDRETRSYRPKLDDMLVKTLRPQEIPRLVEQGSHDVGITGSDWLKESRARVEPLLNLGYGRVRIVLAIPKDTLRQYKIKNVNELLKHFWETKSGLRIATEYIHITEKFITETDFWKANTKEVRRAKPQIILPWISPRSEMPVKILLSHGATEGKPPEDADAIVDNTETGQTLEQNDLKELCAILEESTAWLVANKDSLAKDGLRQNIISLTGTLHRVTLARGFLHLFANLPKYDHEKLCGSIVWKLAQQEATVTESNRGARIDLLIAREDYDKAIDSLHSELDAKDIVAIKPLWLAWPSRDIDKHKAPYTKFL